MTHARTLTLFASLALASALGCGASQAPKGSEVTGAAASGAASAEAPAPAAPTGSSAEPPAPTASAGPPSTTLDVGGAGGGTKLSQAAGDAGAPRAPEPGRSPADIKARVDAHREQIQACYEEGLKRRPGLEGDLVVNWVIDPKGVMTKISIDTGKTQVVDDQVQACVMAVLKKIEFPPSPKGLESRATYPFKLKPRAGKKP